jgi:amino acid adenylation domain-containing protein
MLLHDDFKRIAAEQPDRSALVVGDREYRYGELCRDVERLAVHLQQAGVGRGARVAVYLRNGAEFVVALFACFECGAVAVPLNPQIKQNKLTYILHEVEPAALIAAAELRPIWSPERDALPGLRTVVQVGRPPRGSPPAGRDSEYEHVLAVAVGAVRNPGTIDQDLAAIIYTSGSTGEPKGVMLTHLNMVTARGAILQYLGIDAADRIYCALPLTFDYGLYQVLMAFAIGASVVLDDGFVYVGDMLARLAGRNCTVFPAIPTMISLMMAGGDLRSQDAAGVRLVTNTAAALSPAHIRYIRRNFPGARLFSMYGLTECKRVSYLPPEELDRRPDSIGRGMPNEEVYLVDDQGRRLPHGSIGELVVRGSHVMRGYWRKQAETDECLRPGSIEGERVLHTGDMFRSDAEGYLYFLGRKDDIIKSRGEKVSPREIEKIVSAHDAVIDVAAVGVPDAVSGEAIRLFIRRAPNSQVGAREILAYCAARMERHMTPREVVFVEALPRTPNGKVDKKALQRGEIAHAGGPASQ